MLAKLFGKNKKAEPVQNAAIYSSNYSSLTDFIASSGSHVTPESSKRCTTVYACVQLIGGAIASLPANVYERGPNGLRTQVYNHDYWWLLNERPYAGAVAQSWWEYLVACMLLHGDGFVRISRNRQMVIDALEPIHPQHVVVKKVGGGLVYLVNDGISKKGLDASDVLQFSNFGSNGLRGESVISYAARQAIGTSLAADEFAGEYFKNGAMPSIVFQYPNQVTKEQREALEAKLEERHTGGGNRHRPFALYNGGTVATVSISPEDSQLLETRKFQTVQICQAFGVHPQMIGEAQTGAWGQGLEQISTGFYRYTVLPPSRRFAQEINSKFWPRNTKYLVDFDHDALTAGDLKTQGEYYQRAAGGPGAQGWMTPNEIRRAKGLPDLPDGDKLIISGGPAAAQTQGQTQ